MRAIFCGLGALVLVACGDDVNDTPDQSTEDAAVDSMNTDADASRDADIAVPDHSVDAVPPDTNPPSLDREAERLLNFSNPAIEYNGRWKQEGDEARANWSGSSVRFWVDAESVFLTVHDEANWDGRWNALAVYVDGERTKLIDLVQSSEQEVDIATGLVGPHVIEIQKASESMRGPIVMKSLRLVNALPATAPPTRGRHIEFIGDSISCGAGNLANRVDCNAQENQDTSLAFTALTAAEFDAETTILCRSGVAAREDGFRERLSQTFGTTDLYGLPVEEFTAASPADVVVINLGTNDSSLERREAEQGGVLWATFKESMNDIMDGVRVRYPMAHIILLNGPMVQCIDNDPESICVALDELKEARNDDRVHRLSLPFDTSPGRIGCTNHPTVAHHADLAVPLVTLIETLTGW